MGTLSLAQTEIADDTSGNFEAYQTGDLNGQSGWSDVWNSPLIQQEVVFEGIQAVKNQHGFATGAYKGLSDSFVTEGVTSIKIRVDNNSHSDNQDIFGLYKGIGEEYIALFKFANDFEGHSNKLLLSVAGSTETKTVGSFSQGEWHKISLAWRDSDFRIRVKVDNGEWSGWFSSQTTWNTRSDLGLKISLPDVKNYGNFYIDDLKSFVGSEEPYYDPVLILEEIIPLPAEELVAEPLAVEVLPIAEDVPATGTDEVFIGPLLPGGTKSEDNTETESDPGVVVPDDTDTGEEVPADNVSGVGAEADPAADQAPEPAQEEPAPSGEAQDEPQENAVSGNTESGETITSEF